MALGWKERFVSPLAFFVLDVGIGKPKQPPPLAVMRARVGRHNDDLALPELPVRLPHLVLFPLSPPEYLAFPPTLCTHVWARLLLIPGHPRWL